MVAERQAHQGHRNISLSVPKALVDQLDTWTAEAKTSRSAVVTRLLEAESLRRDYEALEQDIRDAIADGFYDDIEFYLPAQAEVALANPWEWEPEPEAR